MMRTVGRWIGQMRRMTSDFQNQVQSALREAEFQDLKKGIDDLTTMDAMADIREEIESATRPLADMEGQLRSDFTIDPLPKPSLATEGSTPPGNADWPGAMEQTPSPASEGTTLPGNAAWPGAMDLAPESGTTPLEHSEPVPMPIISEMPRLPAHLRGPDPEPADEPVRIADHDATPVARVSGVSS
jgi:sec-independent protein translocase protein TatB